MIEFKDVVPGAIIEINYDPDREINRSAYGLQFEVLDRTNIHQDSKGNTHVHNTRVVSDPSGWNRSNVNHMIGKCDTLIFSPTRVSNQSALICLKTSHDFQ